MSKTSTRKRVTFSAQPTAAAELYLCHMRLEDLDDTSHPEVKYCKNCARSVYRARDIHGYLQLVAADRCAWVSPDDHNDGDRPLLGVPSGDDSG